MGRYTVIDPVTNNMTPAPRRPVSSLMHIAAARLYFHIGWAGCIGLGLLASAFCYGLWAAQQSTVAPEAERPAAFHAIVEQPAAPPATPMAPALPYAKDTVTILKQIKAVAQTHGLSWPQAEYRFAPASTEGLATLEIRTTLKGSYPQLRQVIARLLDTEPALALRELTLSRPSGDTTEVEAKIRWVVFLADGWAPPSPGGEQ